MIWGHGDLELWTPARYVAMHQRCSFCGAPIMRDKPGARVGDRGTKAFFNSARKLWECTPCRMEATRAEMARMDPHEARVEACESCRYERLDSQPPNAAPIFGLIPCTGCELGADAGLHRICPKCRHVEHRSHGAAFGHLQGVA